MLTAKALAKILSASPSKLYLIQDGPRPGYPSDADLVQEVQNEFNKIPSEVEVEELLSGQNMGIKGRIYSALDYIFDVEEQLIIVEDDCLLEESFFFFAQDCLEVYKREHAVAMVSAHRPIPSLSQSKVFFDEVPRIWGWGTWASTWQSFRAEPQQMSDSLLQGRLSEAVRAIRPLTSRLMAKDLYTTTNAKENWDIEFSSHILRSRLLTVSPPLNAVFNAGIENGTHTHEWAFIELPKSRKVKSNLRLTPAVARSDLQVIIEDFLRIFRWSKAFIKNPKAALNKLSQIVFPKGQI